MKLVYLGAYHGPESVVGETGGLYVMMERGEICGGVESVELCGLLESCGRSWFGWRNVDSIHKRGYVELKSGIKRSGGEKDTRKDEIGRRKNKNRREKDVRNYKSNGIFFKKKAVVKS
jgi:hypothetical protein